MADHHHPPVRLQSRAELRDMLVAAGLPRAAAEKVATAGWSAIEPTAAAADALATIRAATEQMKRLI